MKYVYVVVCILGIVFTISYILYGNDHREEVADRLLYFYNGKDTVYKAED